MMHRVLVLGGGGMLGHKLLQTLSNRCEVAGAFRKLSDTFVTSDAFQGIRLFEGVNACDLETIRKVLNEFRPGAILNCIGVIKQAKEVKRAKPTIYINALFPHLLNELATDAGARLIHISTDCVFDGQKGDYTEADDATAKDLYGRTKFLGEVAEGNALTLRTSIIGHEVGSSLSLVDWFRSQEGKTVHGYTRAIYTGVPTVILCDEIWRLLDQFPELRGRFQVSAAKITKYELLDLIKQKYGLNIEIAPSDTLVIDRSLDSTSYRIATGFQPPSWNDMVEQMFMDFLNYRSIYSRNHL